MPTLNRRRPAHRLQPLARSTALIGAAVFATMVLLLTACGVNYGSVQDYNGNHATCGADSASILSGSGDPYFKAWAWKEPTQNGPCNRSDSVGYQAGAGHLGLRIIGYRNGVVCMDWGLGTNPTATNVYDDWTFCVDDDTDRDEYFATVQYRWWAQVPSLYAGVQRNTPSVTT